MKLPVLGAILIALCGCATQPKPATPEVLIDAEQFADDYIYYQASLTLASHFADALPQITATVQQLQRLYGTVPEVDTFTRTYLDFRFRGGAERCASEAPSVISQYLDIADAVRNGHQRIDQSVYKLRDHATIMVTQQMVYADIFIVLEAELYRLLAVYPCPLGIPPYVTPYPRAHYLNAPNAH